MINKFWELFDKKKFMFAFRFVLLFGCLVLVFNLVSIAYSKYESGANSTAKANVAFFVVKEGTYENSIALANLLPSDTPYEYTFNILNYDGNNRTNVNLTYTINFKATTNLPLTFAIYKGTDRTTNLISSESTIQDSNGVYYKIMTNNNTYSFGYTENQTDPYTLVVEFPSTYKNNPDTYQSLIDLFTITIHAEQVV